MRVEQMSDGQKEQPGKAREMSADDLAESIRGRLIAHLKLLGVNGEKRDFSSKEAIRAIHSSQRKRLQEREHAFVEKYGLDLLETHFAEGSEVDPGTVRPELTEIVGQREDARLFRLATLLWSIPVSRGYGRRMRFLVRDGANNKLMGIFALRDPVFNLRARDRWIGWDVEQRRKRLVNVMDAYVVGAVPPYSQLIGAKVVASLMTSWEVCQRFEEKYHDRRGIISGEKKEPKLAVITVTSALGRSSVYNRLSLPGLVKFDLIGPTLGWGHFQVPDDIFSDMRELLGKEGHKYASGYRFGSGPNWRLRVIRVALKRIGLEQDLLRHGISREIHACTLAENWRAYLKGESRVCQLNRPSVEEIGRAAIKRWVIPRAKRRPGYREWTRADTWRTMWPDGKPPDPAPEQAPLPFI